MTYFDWAQVSLNGILVTVNVVLVVIYIKMLKSNIKMVEEASITRYEAYRPEVIAFIREEEGLLFFQIKNTGSRPAYNIHFKIEQLFYNTEIENQKKFIKQIPNTIRDVYKEIHLLAPQQSIETLLGVNEVLLKYNNDHPGSQLDLKYFDTEGKKYNVSYTISITDFEKTNFYLQNELDRVGNEIELLRKEISKQKR